MSSFWREPLLHFLLLGAALFLAYDALDRESAGADSQTIIVDRESLLTFLQYRSRAFDAARFNDRLDKLPENELDRLIRDYVREEALYREAKALRLDRNDYVARRRLVQQLEFITRGVAEKHVEISEEQIERYYEEHRDEYSVEPKVTFTHVFFSRERHGAKRAEALARAELYLLNQHRVRFDQAPAHGERFLYHVNYVRREPEEVASHFGESMQAQLFALKPSHRTWRGPFESPYGFHLVLLIGEEAGHVAPLEEVRGRVGQAARQALLDARFDEAIDSIVKTYTVKIEPIQADELAATKTPS